MKHAYLLLVLCLALGGAVAERFYGARQRRADGARRPAKNCVAGDGDWVTRRDVEFYKLTSQSWQDGYLAYVFQVIVFVVVFLRTTLVAPLPPSPTLSPIAPLHLLYPQNIGVVNKYYVEFGFNSDDFNGGSGANTYSLHKNFGWTGLLLDGGHENAAINLHKEFVRADNIVSLFEKHGVPDEPDYVSIDVDSADVLILDSLLASRFSPRVLTVEYNANFPLDATLSVTPATQWAGDTAYGASLGAIHKVAARHGYELVTVVPHLDAVLVRGDLLCGAKPPPLSAWEAATDMTGHIPPVDARQAADKFMDSEVYFKTGDVAAAQKAAKAYLTDRDYLFARG